jgi:hypothetical protein
MFLERQFGQDIVLSNRLDPAIGASITDKLAIPHTGQRTVAVGSTAKILPASIHLAVTFGSFMVDMLPLPPRNTLLPSFLALRDH